MGDHCTGEGKEGGCCGNCHDRHEEVDVTSLGPEAIEVAKMFQEINDNLVNALKMRAKILQTLHENSSKSPELKEKMAKVVESRHPVLKQFVFQDQ
ncbi:MAG: hypothetical protein V1827_03505 [Candidatus Micrarchaeota archaeon]